MDHGWRRGLRWGPRGREREGEGVDWLRDFL
jgi:hypothetical protein